MSTTIQFEEKPLEFFGKSDEQFVNDKIQELRKKREDLQDKIFELSKQLDKLEEERNNTQKEIDEEFLRQEHAYDLVGKCILHETSVYHVKYVDRLFDGVRIESDWSYNIKTNEVYCSPYRFRNCSISFNELDALLNNNDENCKIIPVENALDTFNQYMQLICKNNIK